MPQTIRNLFGRQLDRRIEKVITYQNAADDQLKNEIGEYVVTDHLQENFEKLLKLIQSAMQGGGGHEIGVWVSGFYGSGKSSFTKYLGFALDKQKLVGKESFRDLLKNQVRSAQVQGLFNSVSNTFDPVVVFLDLASEQLAGSSMADVSTVLHLKVLQWAGYSEDLKVAALEQMLEKDGKLEAFLKRAAEELDGIDWYEVHNQPLAANPIAERLAAEFYPRIFNTPEAFRDLAFDVSKSELKRVEEMVDLVRRKSGKQNILFIVDEVGQYVASRDNLILNLDGLAKNLKQVGQGKVWLFSTAQQTLTEDNPGAMVNAAGLFKLKDRFPIQIHLEPGDIREICHKRLLSKSADGEKLLSALFEKHGAALRTATQLKDAGVYEQALDKRAFVDLYPFLPAHFEILLQLLARLSRRTGGTGLRSAIKVVQDVLLERTAITSALHALADGEVGILANTVTFYDTLKRDIKSGFDHIVAGVDRVAERHPNKPLHLQVAKSIAVLQVLENLPVTAENIAALLQTKVDAPSLREDVKEAIDELLKDTLVPLGEKNGSLRFLTQAAESLQRELDAIEYRNADLRSELSASIRGVFNPLPSARLQGARTVSAGIKLGIGGGQFNSIAGDREPIQFHVEFVQANAYDAERQARLNDSRERTERATVFLLGRTDPEVDPLTATLVRCTRFLEKYRAAGDPDTQEFVKVVAERRERSLRDLEARVKAALKNGSFLFQGEQRPVAEVHLDLTEACKLFLAEVAERVFDRYSEAPVQVDSNVAEKFLRTPLDRATRTEDPLELVTRQGGTARIKPDHKALKSIRDHLDEQGQVEGRRLLEKFSEAPFGWSKDTTRYLVAALLLSSDIKLRIHGKDHSVRNDDTSKALASNNALAPVGITLRQERPDPEALLRAADRLRDLTGETVMFLEDDVAGHAKRHFPTYQTTYATLAAELRALDLPGAQRINDLCDDLAEVASGDGTDAIKRLGAQESALYDGLQWARALKQAFANGLKQTLTQLRAISTKIQELPHTGALQSLRASAEPALEEAKDLLARDRFFDETPALNQVLNQLNTMVDEANTAMAQSQEALRTGDLAKWQSSTAWYDLLAEDKEWVLAEVGKHTVEPSNGLEGLRSLMTHEIELQSALRSVDQWIATKAASRRQERNKASGNGAIDVKDPAATEDMIVCPVLESTDDIDHMIEQLNRMRRDLASGKKVRYTIKFLQEGPVHTKPTKA
jgi:hypothetical protein